MVAGGPCMLEFSFSPEVEWALSSHLHILVVLHASPFHKRRFLRVASRKARLGYSYLLLTHRLLEHPIVILPFWTAEAFDVYLREMIALPIDGEEGVEGLKQELELAWEQMEFRASSGYASAVGEEVASREGGVEEERVEEEEEVEMGEEGLWSPNSSDRAILALVPDAPAFPVQ
ncbi:hypothetical protein BDM02DRAFT_3193622 [Thelephora ganbajun]|uniref:Uncharacterized protein n=1 Tax=Thelephora ganbajun TaxID=370292 RepID=A0ACB6YY59_THEGA|nr:hypothetical protein BDM02DRAFT_3193622 [Thelephora ganbajun]